GTIVLYDTNAEQIISVFDLKKLKASPNQGAPPVVEESKIEEEVSPGKILGLEDFDLIPVTFKKGDTLWKIQQTYTPDLDVDTGIELLKLANKDKDIDLVYVGEMRYVLKHK